MAIIATNVAAIREILRNGETGLMVPAGAAAALTQALWDLATNPAFRSVLGEHAMAHVSRHYDAPTNASRLLGLLKAEANAVRAEKLASPRARFRVVPTRRAENGAGVRKPIASTVKAMLRAWLTKRRRRLRQQRGRDFVESLIRRDSQRSRMRSQ
jgi:hypothetical protein